jgi:hypothetical protein
LDLETKRDPSLYAFPSYRVAGVKTKQNKKTLKFYQSDGWRGRN